MAGPCWAVVLATGKDQTLAGGADIAFLGVGNRPALAHAMAAAEGCRDVEGIVVAAPRERIDMVGAMKFRFGFNKLRTVLPGGTQRISNIGAALDTFEDEVEWAVVLECARPMVTPAMVADTLAGAQRTGAAAMGDAISDPVRVEVRKGEEEALDARCVWAVQTPQVYRCDLLRKAVAAARKRRGEAPDLTALIDAAGGRVRMVQCPRMNLRLRSADDLTAAAHLAG